METSDAPLLLLCQGAQMGELLSATENPAEDETIDCSGRNVIRGVEGYAAYQPAGLAHELIDWAILLEGVRQMREER